MRREVRLMRGVKKSSPGANPCAARSAWAMPALARVFFLATFCWNLHPRSQRRLHTSAASAPLGRVRGDPPGADCDGHGEPRGLCCALRDSKDRPPPPPRIAS
eukprot:TRINITY_DN22181_c0_g1_i3.p6 TRINITY_DN22181_c0_g1~~TRINITY_DN22181_c0_g1_i3.p6  ORF type:complete len:103 (-),score=11.39 TRINITY_DN22181_c0_g1_i3:76-384(-)